jgi:hypothetical protein
MPNFLEQFVNDRNARRDISHIQVEAVKGDPVNVRSSEFDEEYAFSNMSRLDFLYFT